MGILIPMVTASSSLAYFGLSDSFFVKFEVRVHHALHREVVSNVLSDCSRIEIQIPCPFGHFSNRSARVARYPIAHDLLHRATRHSQDWRTTSHRLHHD